MSVTGQTEPPWRKASLMAAKLAAMNVGGAAATLLGGPLGGAAASSLLRAMLESQAAQLEQLDLIRADTQALVRGPYNAGMIFLGEAAEEDIGSQYRREYIEKARDKFVEACAQEHDSFGKALAQYQLGNCWILLGNNARARIWFQRAHESAIGSLYDMKRAYIASKAALVRKYEGFEGPNFWSKLDNWFAEKERARKPVWPLQWALLPVSFPLAISTIPGNVRSDAKENEILSTAAPPVVDLLDSLEDLKKESSNLSLVFCHACPPKGWRSWRSEWLRVWLKRPGTDEPAGVSPPR